MLKEHLRGSPGIEAPMYDADISRGVGVRQSATVILSSTASEGWDGGHWAVGRETPLAGGEAGR